MARRRTRTITGNTTVGRPGFGGGNNINRFTGDFVNQTKASGAGVRRLIARDPAKGTNPDNGVPPILGTVKTAVQAVLSTNLTGNNNDLKYTAKAKGTVGNSITVAYVDPGGTTAALSVSVTGSAITVNLARAASAITTTAAQIITAIQASTTASALVSVALKTGNDGTGIVTALAATNLAGGAQAVTTPVDAVNTTDAPSPNVVKAPNYTKGNAVPSGTERVRNRSSNRRVRRTNSN